MKECELTKEISYYGKYKGVRFKINQSFHLGDYLPCGLWTYYLYLNDKEIPKNLEKRVFTKDKDVCYPSPLGDLSFHCGCTYYEITNREGVKQVEVGCDYHHYRDDEIDYDEKMILQDVKNVIDELLQVIPNLKVWCSSCGAYNEYGKECNSSFCVVRRDK